VIHDTRTHDTRYTTHECVYVASSQRSTFESAAVGQQHVIGSAAVCQQLPVQFRPREDQQNSKEFQPAHTHTHTHTHTTHTHDTNTHTHTYTHTSEFFVTAGAQGGGDDEQRVELTPRAVLSLSLDGADQ
jgi:hypothetical protein